MLTPSTATPTGFGAAYNPFTAAKEFLVQGIECASGAAKISVGSGSTDQYIYKNALYWTGSAWQELPLSGSTLVSDTWYKGTATASMPIGQTPRYVLGYVCKSDGGKWKCGCSDSTCSKPQWQLQVVQAPAHGEAVPSVTSLKGKLDGIWYWTMPTTPAGSSRRRAGRARHRPRTATSMSPAWTMRPTRPSTASTATSSAMWATPRAPRRRPATGASAKQPRSSTPARCGTMAARTSPPSTVRSWMPRISTAAASTGTPTMLAATGSWISARRSRAGPERRAGE